MRFASELRWTIDGVVVGTHPSTRYDRSLAAIASTEGAPSARQAIA